jgi:hypothetical protein
MFNEFSSHSQFISYINIILRMKLKYNLKNEIELEIYFTNNLKVLDEEIILQDMKKLNSIVIIDLYVVMYDSCSRLSYITT